MGCQVWGHRLWINAGTIGKQCAENAVDENPSKSKYGTVITGTEWAYLTENRNIIKSSQFTATASGMHFLWITTAGSMSYKRLTINIPDRSQSEWHIQFRPTDMTVFQGHSKAVHTVHMLSFHRKDLPVSYKHYRTSFPCINSPVVFSSPVSIGLW